MNKRAKRKMKRYGMIGAVLIFGVVSWKIYGDITQGLCKEWRAANAQMTSEVVQAWLEEGTADMQKLSQLGIMTIETSELFEINLAKGSGDGLSFEQMTGEQLKISGRRDADRGYFEGKIVWSGQEICIMNFGTKEYAVLKEDIRSFILGDYYVSCRYNLENNEVELLIFYCPV